VFVHARLFGPASRPLLRAPHCSGSRSRRSRAKASRDVRADGLRLNERTRCAPVLCAADFWPAGRGWTDRQARASCAPPAARSRRPSDATRPGAMRAARAWLRFACERQRVAPRSGRLVAGRLAPIARSHGRPGACARRPACFRGRRRALGERPHDGCGAR
jgi:hypothetical protein